ncbi:hypothetical protein HPB48_005189 [Haemaphysalis longicornis]|uniref:Endonuclease-reverse transcriptase n=1 Tax=Haemaphysalis longicornis TaxID=44386 RepID=A0A9J6FF31_HAELO|nr:hypothetical protein HPB48_005189 [Haemaphysalis longicornis]
MITEINEKLGKTKQEIEGLNKSASEQANTITSLTQRVKDLQSRNNKLENRSRQQNLVFYGVDDNNRAETWDQSENLITTICKEELQIDLHSIQKAHRVGRYTESGKRPIVVNFSSYKEKQSVLTNAKKFKGSPYSVDQDYSPETRDIRKRLWEYAKAKRTDKDEVKLKGDRIVINGQAFVWDKEEEVVQVRKR